MKRFIVRFVLGALGAWVAGIIIPGVMSDGNFRTYILMGLFIAIGEILLFFFQGGAAIIFFIVPRPLRNFLLRMLVVAIAAELVTGFGFSLPFTTQLTGLAGLSLLYSLLFLLPFSA